MQLHSHPPFVRMDFIVVSGNEVSAIIAHPQKLGYRDQGRAPPLREPVFRV